MTWWYGFAQKLEIHRYIYNIYSVYIYTVYIYIANYIDTVCIQFYRHRLLSKKTPSNSITIISPSTSIHIDDEYPQFWCWKLPMFHRGDSRWTKRSTPTDAYQVNPQVPNFNVALSSKNSFLCVRVWFFCPAPNAQPKGDNRLSHCIPVDPQLFPRVHWTVNTTAIVHWLP